MRVHLAADAASADLTSDDRLLCEAVRDRDVDAAPLVWGQDVAAGDTVLIRSTWDYVERTTEFLAWLDHIDQLGANVINPIDLLRWNAHKSYLLDLEHDGHPIVPTLLVPRGATASIHDIRRELDAARVVVKPAIGASAKGAVESGSAGDDVMDRLLAALLATGDVVAQPFVESVGTRGELSVVAFGGLISHGVRKTAATGEWRVQTEFGGSLEREDPSPADVAVCRRLLDRLAQMPVYARIDLVAIDGAPHLMELELIEPDLFFSLAPGSAERLVDVVLGRS